MTLLRIPPTLRDTTGGEREITGSGSTLRELFEDVTRSYPDLGRRVYQDGELVSFVNVYVGGEDARTLQGLDTPVGATTVILLPAMAGGDG